MSKEDVIDYVMTTPSNPNRAVLSGMLDEVSGTQLPSPTVSDNGKVLGVDGGEYKLVEQSKLQNIEDGYATGSVKTIGATAVNGNYAFAEGEGTAAKGDASHAEGFGSIAFGSASHAEGLGVYARGQAQHAFGSYNIQENVSDQYSYGTYIEIVGNGTSSSSRSNARTLDWSGNESLKGSLTLGKGTSDEVTITASQLKALLAKL